MNSFDRQTIQEMRSAAIKGAVNAEIHMQLEEITLKESSNGKPYYELRMRDSSGSLLLRAWSDTPPFDQCGGLKSGNTVGVGGEFYNNPPFGVDIRKWGIWPLEQHEVDALYAGSPERNQFVSREKEYIFSTIDELKDLRLRALGNAFIAEYGDRFVRSAAARSYHHSRRGGLVEHVAQMMRAMKAICDAYPRLNRDLCLSGVLFHDCGKLWETGMPEAGFTMPYQKPGELLGHITIGIEVVNKLWHKLPLDEWKEIQPPSEDVRLHLLHLIASHHGELQFGAPVLPKTPEAIALHYVDNLDARLETIFSGYATATEIGTGIYERVRPMVTNFVKQLDPFSE